uniref:HAT C-terminal dimerisation domain-containing protein n=1 Tax=Latimeria chalumnae TaxID=7897 RepID=H3ADP1_LATCH
EAFIALYIAKHSLLCSVDHLTELCKVQFRDSHASSLKLHTSKCTAIVDNVLAPHFITELVSDVGDGPYCLLLDESNDISVLKVLGVVIRYFSVKQKKIVSRFLSLVALEDFNADGIIAALNNCISNIGLLQNLNGISTDNASVMTGINNGLYSKLKSEIPHLVLVRCVCHSLELAVSHAYEQTLTKFLDFLVKETYNCFSQGAGWQITYNTLFVAINDGAEPHKPLWACATRWISFEPAVKRILEQWLELKTLFSVAHEKEHCYMADRLYTLFCDPQSHTYLTVKNVLLEVQAVNKTFEGNNTDPTKLLDGLVRLITSLGCSVMIPTAQYDFLTCDVHQYLYPHPHLGYEAEKALRDDCVPEAVEASIRERCGNLKLVLLEKIQNRLPENVEILRKMSAFSVGPIIELTAMKSPEEINKIEVQWRNIHYILWENVDDTEQFRNATNEKPFRELCNLALRILSLPHSNAEVEHVFSQLNLIKNKLRSCLSLSFVNAILHVCYKLKRGKC